MKTFFAIRRSLVLLACAVVPAALATPTISFTPGAFPATGSPVALSTTPTGLNISVTAAPTAGATISSVSVSVNGTVIGTATGSSPFVVNWVPTTAGNFTITASVTDTSGNTAGSPNTATINANVTVNTARAATIVSPANNFSVPIDSQIFLRSTATMTDGTVASVQYILDPGTSDTVIGTANQAPYNVAYTVTAATGAHTLLVRATATDGTTTFDSATLNFTVSASVGTGPTVTMTSPTSGDAIIAGTAVTVSATASDSDGFIPSTSPGGVTFYADGDPIATDLTAPYSVSWTPTVPKTVSLRAQATDDKGNIRLSAPVSVSVTSTAPTVAITSPANNSTATVGTSLFITASATAPSGSTVANVQFFENGVAIGVADTAAPYTVQWTPATVGTAVLTARVTDSVGNGVTSAPINVTVGAAAPTVTLNAPSTAVVNTVTTLTATASPGTNASIVQVQFLSGNTVLGTDSSAPYTFDWTPTSTGNVTLSAKVTDSNGATTTSSSVTVAVSASTPSVSITSPVNGAAIPVGTATTVSATATASSGATVTRVDFLAGNTTIGTALTAPFSITWTPTTSGIIALTAKVTDSSGATSTSSAVNVNVTSAGAPTVSLTAPPPGRIVSVGNNVTLSANATAATGNTVSAVEFLAGNSVIASADISGGGPSYTSTWRPAAAGTFAITARVTDNTLATATSSPAVNITVVAAPTVAITGPTSPVVAGTATNVTANATAGQGLTVTSVEFFAGQISLGSSSTPPYSVSWTPSANGPASIPLTARVTDSSGTTLTSNAVTVSVTGTIGSTLNVTLSPSGTINMAAGSSRVVTATSTVPNIDHIELIFDDAVIATDNTAPYNFVFTAPGSLFTGPHSLAARVVDTTGATGTSAQTIINVQAPAGTPPLIGITTPASNSFLGPNVSTVISGTATDADGAITSVQVLVNGATTGLANGGLSTLAGSNWSINWTTPTTPGVYSIVAIANDSSGNAVAAPPVNVTVGDSASPTLSLTLLPGTAGNQASSTLPSGAVRNIVANAAAASGRAVVRVEFFVDGTKVGEDTAAPFTYRYVAPPLDASEQSRTFVFSARATDNAGAARDAFLPLLVVQPVGTPPTVNLLTPPNNATVFPNTDVSMAATAVPTSGASIANVQFFVNGNIAGITTTNPVTAAPYVGTFRPTAPGVYTIDAIATDDRGNTAISNSVTVTAAFNTPTIAITSPNPNATARATPGVPLNLTATATVQGNTGASVLLVEFLLDGAQIGADTTAPYTFSWTPTSAQLGLHQITARVTDTNAQTATSNPVNVNVANLVGTPPTISITQPSGGGGVGQAGNLQSLSQVNFVANAAASAPGVTISNVEFFLNDQSIGLGAREQSTNLYRLAYDFSRFDFSTAPSITDPNTGLTRYTPIPFYAIARDSNNNQTVSPTLNLTVNTATSSPPAISLQVFNSLVEQGTPVILIPNFSDSDGTVVQIQLYANGTLVSNTPNPQPNQLITYNTNNASGRVNLYAVAVDDTGNTAVSSPAVVVTVNQLNAPTTTLTRPVDDSTVTSVNVPVFLEGTASATGTTQVPTLQFIATSSTGTRTTIFGQRVGTTTTYRAIWTPTTFGTYTISTQANLGATAQSTSSVTRRVVVNNLSGLAPTVSIAGGVPTSAQTASKSNFTATATDPDGSVVQVEFFLNRNSIGFAQQDPGANTWRLTAEFAGVLPGSVEVVALARDSSGNVAASTTNTITVTAAQSIAPTITITPSTTNAAFNRQVQLRANARDTDGTINSVQYFANATSLGSTNSASTNYQVNWTPNQSGKFKIWAVATDNSGITTVAPTVEVTVRRNNPVLENAAFILQTYQDIANTTNILSDTFNDLDDQLARGTLTRAQLISDLINNSETNPGFAAPVNLLAAYYAIMGEWPTPATYTSLLATARGSLPNAIGNILSSSRYGFKYNNGVATSSGTLTTTFNNDFNTLKAFVARLWANTGRGTPSDLQVTQFRSNPTVVTAPPLGPLGRGYGVGGVGLNTALSEFITVTNSTNAAFIRMAQVAAMYYQLERPPTPSGLTDSQIVDPIGVRIGELLKLADHTAVADALLKDTLYIYRYVTITKQPESHVVAPRSGVLLSVEAMGAPPLAYQWLLNGAPIANATNATLSLTNVDARSVGSYTVVVTSQIASDKSDPAMITLSSTPTRLANISTRGVTNGGNNVLIGGFVVAGTNQTQTRQMLIRVIGPSLAGAPFNVQGTLADPRLELYAANSSTPVLTNDNWASQTGGAAQVNAIQQATQRIGAFTLNQNSLDAVVLATLPPGSYTVQAKGPANNPNATGVVLIEAYDVTANNNAPGKAMNVSTRGSVGTGTNILIAGFVVNGGVSRRVLIRGVGPTLTRFGLAANSILADPQLTLVDQGTGKTIATNDDWASNDDTAGVIAAAASQAGAFALANGSKDAAMIVMLPPGAYTVQLSGVNNGQGIGIVEVYDVDP